MENLLPRLLNLASKVWLRLTSPSGMRLLAPLLAIALVYLGWRLWHLAGRSPLGLAVRWWALGLALTVFATGVLYGVAGPPADPELRAVLRETAGETVGKAPLPAPLALLGALAVAGASLLAAWRWRLSRLAPAEAEALTHSWRRLRRRGRLPLALFLGALLALAVTAVAAGSGAGQAPPPVAGAAAGTGGSPTLWVGTGAGISRLIPGPTGPRWQTHLPPHAPLPAAHVTALAAAPGGEVWVATHGGLARYSETGGPGGQVRWRRATVENAGLPYPTVLGLAVDRHGVAWAATGAGAAMIDLDAGAARSGRSRAFTGANAPLMHQIMDAAYVDSGGRVWFGSAGGVNVYRPAVPGEDDGEDEEGEWVTGFNRVSTAGRLPDNQVYTVLGDSRGRVWFGTAGGAAALTPDPDGFGLGAFEQSRWMTLTRPDVPLAADEVHAIAEDSRGRLYFGTRNGISVLDES
ncbi:MAG TPA: two-component regulator propeller domain-containing protein, partial [Chloroflexota bacterium]|nr:two-component regulator propeller domain-containing protein [Chloroflexota bacterium]